MFLLPPRVRDLLEKRPRGLFPGVFAKNETLVRRVREMAAFQHRAEQEIYDDIIESGMKALSDEDQYEDIWASLSSREQEVTALTCLGYRSYEIAGALGISYETVRTHSKHVYAKFGLNRMALRQTLGHWDFAAWWGDRQI